MTFVIGKYFGYWLLVGTASLVAVCLCLAPLNYFQNWLDRKRAEQTEHKQVIALSARMKARLYNEKQARSMRPAMKLEARRNGRGGNDAA